LLITPLGTQSSSVGYILSKTATEEGLNLSYHLAWILKVASTLDFTLGLGCCSQLIRLCPAELHNLRLTAQSNLIVGIGNPALTISFCPEYEPY